MNPDRIVEVVDVVLNRSKDNLFAFPYIAVDELPFEGSKEAFCNCVVPAVSSAAEGGHKPRFRQPGQVVSARVLAPPVAVVHEARRRLPQSNGLIQGGTFLCWKCFTE